METQLKNEVIKEQNIDNTRHSENDKRKLKRTKRRKSRIKTGVKLLITSAILFIAFFLWDLAGLGGLIGGLLATGFTIFFIIGIIYLVIGFAGKK